jgi:hypothetical protein
LCASDDDSAIKSFYCRCLRGKKKPPSHSAIAENKKIINETLYYFGRETLRWDFGAALLIFEGLELVQMDGNFLGRACLSE